MTSQLYKEHGLQMVFRNIILLFIRGICTLNGLKMLERIEWRVGEAAVISQWGVCRACHNFIESFGKQVVDDEFVLTTARLYFAYWWINLPSQRNTVKMREICSWLIMNDLHLLITIFSLSEALLGRKSNALCLQSPCFWQLRSWRLSANMVLKKATFASLKLKIRFF